MSGEPAGGWVVGPPPAAGEISLFVAVGEGVELSPQQEDALGQLLGALEAADAEVVGLGSPACPKNVVTGCDPLSCSTVICKSLVCWKLNPKAAAASAGGFTISGTFGLTQ